MSERREGTPTQTKSLGFGTVASFAKATHFEEHASNLDEHSNKL